MNREKLESYLEKNPFAKLSEVVTQILYDQIVVLDIPPASKLNINQIATDLGISRTPVVEAINRLQAIGFVETRAQGQRLLCHGYEPARYDRPLRCKDRHRMRSRRPLRRQGLPRGDRPAGQSGHGVQKGRTQNGRKKAQGNRYALSQAHRRVLGQQIPY